MVHGGFTVSSAISAAFSVNICDMHGGFILSSSAICAAFSVNNCDGAWRIHCVFCSLCCFLCKYIWRCMEDSLCLLLLSLLLSL